MGKRGIFEERLKKICSAKVVESHAVQSDWAAHRWRKKLKIFKSVFLRKLIPKKCKQTFACPF